MTTGDEEPENLVDNLLDDVDDQFQDLEREYNQAREGIVVSEQQRRGPGNPLEASNERFELLSQVAALQADVSRQGDQLDERDRMLAELGEQVAGFQADVAKHDQIVQELHAANQAVLEERREQARIQALLDARAVERQELADVAQRMQNERDNVQELLATSMERNEEIEAARLEIDDKLRHLEAARGTAAQEHDARARELIDARAEISRLEDRLETAIEDARSLAVKAEKADALAERRGNEAGYLNRRIEALTEKLDNASGFEPLVADMRRQASIDERRMSELDRNIVSLQGELEAANAAVEAVATRTRDYDELVAKVATLEKERDAAWEAASGQAEPSTFTEAANSPDPAEDDHDAIERSENAERAADLVARAKELGAQRAKEAAAAAEAAEEAAAQQAKASANAAFEADQAALNEAAPATVAEVPPAAQLEALEVSDLSVIDSDLADVDVPQIAPPVIAAPVITAPTQDATTSDADDAALPPPPEVPRIDQPAPGFVFEQSSPDPTDPVSTNEVPVIHAPVAEESPVIEAPRIEAPVVDAPAPALPVIEAPRIEAPVVDAPAPPPPVVAAPIMAAPNVAPPPIAPPAIVAPTPTMPAPTEPPIAPAIATPVVSTPTGPAPTAAPGDLIGARKRTILPTDLVPNTGEAIAHLLRQPGVTAIVDARSTCGRTGVRPSELFDRVAALRDHFDVPVEVVVTPVSTPVGGAPDLEAIGVHHVTGADTVADRVRALCMGFPADQPLVVVAGDDHVRRAAIGEEANVVEPSAVLDFLAE